MTTPEHQEIQEYKRTRSKEANEAKKKTETWWVEEHKSYMTPKDHQDVMFDEARMGEELEVMEKVKRADDELKGRVQKKRFGEEEEDEDEGEGEGEYGMMGEEGEGGEGEHEGKERDELSVEQPTKPTKKKVATDKGEKVTRNKYKNKKKRK